PEDDLLLQVQGMIAEYERAKIMERHRRGKRHAARMGAVNVLSGAPYGYRYISKYEGGGQARYEIVPDEARLVRQVFDWVGRDRLTIGEVCRRLTQAGERTRTGKTVWDRSVVWGMLKNPAYQGTAAFGKPHQEPLHPRLSPSARKGKPRTYAYYRCLGTDAYRFGGERICQNTQVRTDRLDVAVWGEVCTLLAHPERLAEEYRRRLQPDTRTQRPALDTVEAHLGKLRQGLARLIGSY